ncbi:MAG: NAD+ synthase [Hyphomicrobiaceae bacterium]|nr:MAG: NAD+ synthase [Hyphomicrobiaceae bacterium]
MTNEFRLALAQLNPVMGDLAGNADKALQARQQARALGADAVVFPELFVSGYPPEDLVQKSAFVAAVERTVEGLAKSTGDGGPAMIIGTPWPGERRPYNSVALLANGRVEALRHKVDLPNYGVFDEKRVFEPGPLPGPVSFKGVRLGLPICEDIWGPDPVECIAETGGEILVVINGSPYRRNVMIERMNAAVARVAESGLPMVYVNQVGGQDELVFEGASFVLNSGGGLAAQLPAFEEAVRVVAFERTSQGWRCRPAAKDVVPEREEADYRACVLGLRDYVEKNGFPGVVLGLSGGIDSALVAAMATDALGPKRVHCLMMPYRFTSNESLSDAARCAEALGVRYDTVPISAPVEGFLEMLKPLFAARAADTTEENIQSRVRGTILMAVSNKLGSLVLTTGNKSEMSVGYATLYGDMNGGFNPIKDLYKMEVYRTARWRNRNVPKGAFGPAGEVIPANILTKAPSAELRENQKDQDSLPPYEVLDDILEALVEEEMPLAEIVAKRGHDAATVRKVEKLLYVAEYKRRQAAPGVKITSRNFGRDRRYPITNRFREDLAAPPRPSVKASAAKLVAPRADGGEVS